MCMWHMWLAILHLKFNLLKIATTVNYLYRVMFTDVTTDEETIQ